MITLEGIDFTEVFSPKPVGEIINTHVVPNVQEPRPDYNAMQRLIDGGKNLTSPHQAENNNTD